MSVVLEKLPLPVLNREDLIGFLNAYEAKRERNIDHNLQQGVSLITRGSTTFTFLNSPIYAVPTPSRDTESNSPRSGHRDRAFGFGSTPPSNTSITLLQRLTPELGHRAQLWIAHINDNPEKVAVKVFQECLVDNIPWWSPVDNEVMGFWPEDESSHREAWAYHTLRHLQGSVIPHSYGFYDVGLFPALLAKD
jgi:hypothetical protein